MHATFITCEGALIDINFDFKEALKSAAVSAAFDVLCCSSCLNAYEEDLNEFKCMMVELLENHNNSDQQQ